MKPIFRLTLINLIRLKRRLCLLLAIAAAFGMLSLLLVQGVSSLTIRDSGLSKIIIGVVGSDGENETLVSLASSMTDIQAYSEFVALDSDEAMDALDSGEVFAVIELPENVINSILSGENSPIYLHLSPTKPTESLITLYAGECATDMLSAAQGAIYAVLDRLQDEDLYDENSVVDVNFDFISFALGRGNMFEEEVVSVVGTVSLSEHYLQAVLIFVLLMSSVILYPVLSKKQGAWLTRMSSIGVSAITPSLARIFTALIIFIPLCTTIYAISGEFSIIGIIFPAVFFAGFSAFVCCICSSESLASATVFALSGIMLFLSGGVIPPILLPMAIKPLSDLMPTTWLFNSMRGENSVIILAFGIIMLGGAFWMYKGAYEKGERR